MPRRDGFPTNEELLDTFNQNGRDIFVAALEHDFAHKMPDYMKGKQLGDIFLKVHHIIPPSVEGFTNPVNGEKLEMTTLDESDADYVRSDHLRWKGTDVGDRIDLETMFLAETILDDDFVPATIGKWAVYTSYTASMEGTTRTRHVDTLKEKPTKQALISGIVLEEAVSDYVRSTDFEIPAEERAIDAVLFGRGREDFRPFMHNWGITFRAGMTFNGYESDYYLQYCLDEAQYSLERTMERTKRMQEMGGPAIIIDDLTEKAKRLKISIASAKNALEKK